MAIKSDSWIRRMVKEQQMIEPFVDGQVRDGVISYGLSSYGYDIRVSNEFKIFTNVHSAVVDPKHFDPARLWILAARFALFRPIRLSWLKQSNISAFP